MSVRIFYPVSCLLVIGMVFLALKPGLDRDWAWRQTLSTVAVRGLVIEGVGLRAIIANERASIEFREAEQGGYLVVGSSGVVTNEDANGAHYFVPVDALRQLLGREVDVNFEVRSAEDGGSTEWLARAVLPGALDTGWFPLHADNSWSTASLRLEVPQDQISEPMGLMMWSDAKGDSGRIELRRIFIQPRTSTGNAALSEPAPAVGLNG